MNSSPPRRRMRSTLDWNQYSGQLAMVHTVGLATQRRKQLLDRGPAPNGDRLLPSLLPFTFIITVSSYNHFKISYIYLNLYINFNLNKK
jgi:hypothetical protein